MKEELNELDFLKSIQGKRNWGEVMLKINRRIKQLESKEKKK